MQKPLKHALVALGILSLGLTTLFPFHSEANPDNSTPVNVEVNGVKVVSKANRKINGVTYVDVQQYANLFDGIVTFKYDETKKTYLLNGEPIPTKTIQNVPTAKVNDIVQILGEKTKTVGYQKITEFKDTNTVYVVTLPKGVEQFTPEVPGMGDHWAKKDEWPHGPIYGIIDGKLAFVEEMIEASFFDQRKEEDNIPGMQHLPSPPVEHTDIQYEKYGHMAMEEPHFDIHHYFLSHKEHLLAGEPRIAIEFVKTTQEELAFPYFIGGMIATNGPSANKDEGFGILYVDGKKHKEILKDNVGHLSISGLSPGEHTLKVELKNNTGTKNLFTKEFKVNIQ